METLVYMDHNATTPVRPEARHAVVDALALAGNASSVHGPGRAARRLIEDGRDAVAALVHGDPAGVVFTSGGTEANNLALRGTKPERVLVSAVEHPSVLEARDDVETIPVDEDGIVDLDALRALLEAGGGPVLVSVMVANNETGAIQPVADVARLAHQFGATVHCDAVQAAGKVAIDLGRLGADLISLSAHKLGGPQGTGALVARPGIEIGAVTAGGGQERGLRAGTENVPGIAGFAAAAEAAEAGLSQFKRLARWRDRIERELGRLAPVRVFAGNAPRLPNTTCLTMPGVAAEKQIVAFDLLGVALSAGAACSSGKVAASHVLAAMGADAAEADSAIRISLGWSTTEDDARRFIAAWTDVFTRMGGRSGAKAKSAAGMAA